ncbi:MAG: hypothetical protein KBD63_06020 [Bacteriovoracaceae bacterium]|nr:hypothetical protein [Bacteriovoracaceae bacterium]
MKEKLKKFLQKKKFLLLSILSLFIMLTTYQNCLISSSDVSNSLKTPRSYHDADYAPPSFQELIPTVAFTQDMYEIEEGKSIIVYLKRNKESVDGNQIQLELSEQDNQWPIYNDALDAEIFAELPYVIKLDEEISELRVKIPVKIPTGLEHPEFLTLALKDLATGDTHSTLIKIISIKN